jgi:hypothetical protein
MVSAPVCPACGSLGVGERCASCGAKMNHPPAPLRSDMSSVSVPGLELDVAQASATAAPVEDLRHRKASAYLALAPSETAVLHAASRILAGFITAGGVTEANEKDLSDRAVRLATRMALVIEKYVQSDDEDW